MRLSDDVTSCFEKVLHRIAEVFDSLAREQHDQPVELHVEWRPEADRDGTETHQTTDLVINHEDWIKARVSVDDGETRYRHFDLDYVRRAWIRGDDLRDRLLFVTDSAMDDWWEHHEPNSDIVRLARRGDS